MGIINDNKESAARVRLWRHTIGITNRALSTSGPDPLGTGLSATEEEKVGTGVAIVWGDCHFILTAKHVLDEANVSDLSFFVGQTGDLKTQRASEVTMQDAVVPVPLNDPEAVIHRCDWEDLAVLTITPDAFGPMLEFFDIGGSSIDPQEGETVAGVAYPVSNSVILDGGRIGSVIQRTVVLSPTPFGGAVLPSATGKYLGKFEPDRHYLIPYEPAKEGKHPRGISGAALWVESDEERIVWAPRFKFAGICTVCYGDGGLIEQIVRASVVREFLLEAFGSPEK
jgi:hypothetical protein